MRSGARMSKRGGARRAAGGCRPCRSNLTSASAACFVALRAAPASRRCGSGGPSGGRRSSSRPRTCGLQRRRGHQQLRRDRPARWPEPGPDSDQAFRPCRARSTSRSRRPCRSARAAPDIARSHAGVRSTMSTSSVSGKRRETRASLTQPKRSRSLPQRRRDRPAASPSVWSSAPSHRPAARSMCLMPAHLDALDLEPGHRPTICATRVGGERGRARRRASPSTPAPRRPRASARSPAGTAAPRAAAASATARSSSDPVTACAARTRRACSTCWAALRALVGLRRTVRRSRAASLRAEFAGASASASSIDRLDQRRRSPSRRAAPVRARG